MDRRGDGFSCGWQQRRGWRGQAMTVGVSGLADVIGTVA
jgi:hypothetical protein